MLPHQGAGEELTRPQVAPKFPFHLSHFPEPAFHWSPLGICQEALYQIKRYIYIYKEALYHFHEMSVT